MDPEITMRSADVQAIETILLRYAARAEVDDVDYTVLGTQIDGSGGTLIKADRFGLLRMAAHFLALARKHAGAHIHFDEHSEMDPCDVPLTVVLVESHESTESWES